MNLGAYITCSIETISPGDKLRSYSMMDVKLLMSTMQKEVD